MKATTAMEGGERSQSHRSGSEFFICFTARPSSSSTSCSAAMRVPSSKSLLSPGRGRDQVAPSLSASLSRRLRSSGSVKGGQSPMFPAASKGGGGRRKGCAFEAVEPSSPKVTCIGQVRVKTKKKKNQGKGQALLRSRSQRSGGAEASFRRTSEQENKNQRWVNQLPLSICEALSCFVPCGGGRSPCSSRTGEEKRGGGNTSRRTSSCGTVFTRWLMAIQEESEEGKRGEVVGLVVEEREKGEVGFLVREREKRELGFLGVEEVGNVEKLEKKEEVAVEEEEEEEEEGRASVCIPPRNALLLMRCRSDPVRVAALADRFWGSPDAKAPCDEDPEEEDACETREVEEDGNETKEEEEVGEDLEEQAELVSSETGEVETEETATEKSRDVVVSSVALEEQDVAEEEVNGEEEERQQQRPDEEEEEEEEEGFSADSARIQRNPPEYEGAVKSRLQEAAGEKEVKNETHFLEREEESEEGDMKGRRSSRCASSKAKEGGRRRKERKRHSFSSASEARRQSFSTEREARRASFSVDGEVRRRWSFSIEKEELIQKVKASTPSAVAEVETNREEMSIGAAEVETSKATEETQESTAAAAEVRGGKEEEEKRREIPECLLLMMYEPKLSTEVSKETWVCSTDFLRWLPDDPRYGRRRPHHPFSKAGGGGPETGGAGGVSGEDSYSGNEGATAPAEADVTTPPPPPPPSRPPPPPPPTASAVEHKLIGSAAAPPEGPTCGQFVLTRCKSEPVRSSARLTPDACFWKDRHRPIGVAGIGC